MNSKIRIAIVDDQKLFRAGLERLLSDFDYYAVVMSADQGKQILQMAPDSFDLLLMDVSMPEMDGIELAPKVKNRFPGVKILALSMYDNPEYIIKLMNLGVHGYLLKDSEIAEIRKAITKVVEFNEFHFSETVATAMFKRGQQTNLPNPIQNIQFTPKELTLIQHLCDGLSAAEAGEKMHISVHTVNGHKDRIMDKMNVKNIAGLVSYAFRNNLVSR